MRKNDQQKQEGLRNTQTETNSTTKSGKQQLIFHFTKGRDGRDVSTFLCKSRFAALKKGSSNMLRRSSICPHLCHLKGLGLAPAEQKGKSALYHINFQYFTGGHMDRQKGGRERDFGGQRDSQTDKDSPTIQNPFLVQFGVIRLFPRTETQTASQERLGVNLHCSVTKARLLKCQQQIKVKVFN